MQALQKLLLSFVLMYLRLRSIFGKNNSALKLGQARGTAVVAAVNHDLPVFEYAARLAKKTVVGTGAADKCQVQEMVTRILKLSSMPQSDADALAIAITHAHSLHHSLQVSNHISNINQREIIPHLYILNIVVGDSD